MKRIYLVRHGESEGNLDTTLYLNKADHAIKLSPKGIGQAMTAGLKLNKELTALGENIEKTILQINTNISSESSTLTDKKQHFKKIIAGFDYYQGALSGADQMIDDFKTLYNNQYYKNVQIIYGIGIIGFIITFVMKKK